jgi:hypothetical protein
MGFEHEVEQSLPRPCLVGRFKRTCELTLIHRPARDIIPPLSGARVSSYRIESRAVMLLLLLWSI